MYTKVKTEDEIKAIRESGKILATVLNTINKDLEPGITTRDIAERAAIELQGLGAQPAFLGFMDYPDVICISVNDEIVHGLPSDRELKQGDIVSLDFGVVYDGMITDSARTYTVGDVSPEVKKLIDGTRESLAAGVSVIKDGVNVGTIGAAVQEVLERHRLGIIRDLVGHGVGHTVHEEPNVPNYGMAGSGDSLKAGMTIAVEPMATLGGEKVQILEDGWTVITQDRSLSAHFEDTILITESGHEVLTKI